jgi:radical SAM superfamily enzyme YgiQ (UPF0313 family)
MKILLVAINAKYEHEGLAVWCLKAACRRRGLSVAVQQHTINDPPERTWSAIMDETPDFIGFSCYIWNRTLVERLISDIKKARPEVIIAVGGPETSYAGAEEDFRAFGADYVIKGAGENQLPDLLMRIEGTGAHKPGGAEDCDGSRTYISPVVPEYLSRIKGRIAYIESSRGCPYSCSYCLSSEGGVVYFPLEEVFSDIEALVGAGAKVVKFVDRSFSVNADRSLEVWEYIGRFNPECVTFHFEINPDRLTSAQMGAMERMPAGLMQIEAGIQSVNEETLKAVSRKMDVELALRNLKELVQKGNIHVHADLIAGLPFEDLDSFKKSFDALYDVGPHNLQHGFLKLLHGSRIRREAETHGYKFRDYPPYEVISSRWMSYGDMMLLKGIEDVLDRFHNSGRLRLTLEYLVSGFGSAFGFYAALHAWIKDKGLAFAPIAAARLYSLIREFALGMDSVDLDILESLLGLDYICSMRTTAVPDDMVASGGNKHGLKVLDAWEFLQGAAGGLLGKKAAGRRYIAVEGLFPLKKGEEIEYRKNRMMIDTKDIDPVTGRAKAVAIPDSLQEPPLRVELSCRGISHRR